MPVRESVYTIFTRCHHYLQEQISRLHLSMSSSVHDHHRVETPSSLLTLLGTGSGWTKLQSHTHTHILQTSQVSITYPLLSLSVVLNRFSFFFSRKTHLFL